MITRIAPTPSGFLHFGNLLNFKITADLARAEGGKLWLRIDDVDATRMRPEYVEHIFEALQFLAIQYDFGPRTSDEFFRHQSQALRKQEYFDAIPRLLTYACSCSRSQIQARTDKAYDGHCRNLRLEFQPGKTALRIKLNDFADPVIWTKEDLPAYHWVSILDDLRMQTTHIVRGEDLRPSSMLQIAIALAIGKPQYAAIKHIFHPLLLNSAGEKLSKSAGDSSIATWMKNGKTAEEIWAELTRIKP